MYDRLILKLRSDARPRDHEAYCPCISASMKF